MTACLFRRVMIFVIVSATAAAVILIVDAFVHPPQGFLTWRLISSTSSYGAETSSLPSCWWDYEGGWRIGTAVGSSPSTLQVRVDASQSGLPPVVFSCLHIPVTASRRITFVADPFLLPMHGAPHDWFMFFEQKNVAVTPPRGQLAVARSSDLGQSWAYVGEIIPDATHLSYPFVVFDPVNEVYVLIPESSHSLEVRVYTASAASLPLGWKYERSPLIGAPYADTSPVHHRADRLWYIFTTVGRNLYLYHAEDLLHDEWQLHPASPLYTDNRLYARSAGRPVLYDGLIHRYTQVSTHYYGEAVRITRVTRISASIFEEDEVGSITPQSNTWASTKIHHVDAQPVISLLAHQPINASLDFLARLSANSTTIDNEPLWFAVLDGDTWGEDELFWREEGFFIYVKRSALLVFPIVACLALYAGRMASSLRFPAPGVYRGENVGEGLHTEPKVWTADGLYSFLLDRNHRKCSRSRRRNFPLGYHGDAEASMCEIDTDEEETLSKGSIVLCAVKSVSLGFVIAVVVFVAPLFIQTFPIATSPALFPHLGSGSSIGYAIGSVNDPSLPLNGSLVVVTAASFAYFDRLSNFVGSTQFWAAGMPILIYDLDLTYQQRKESETWRDVTVLSFPFHLYPIHVRNLFFYCWKILILSRVFEDFPSASQFVFLDAGLELRSRLALPRISAALSRQGYWFATQPNTVDQMTDTQTIALLNISKSAIKGKPFCAAGLISWQKDSHAYQQVIPRAVACALQEECIMPVTAGQDNHRPEQGILSALLYATGRHCDSHPAWKQWDMSKVGEDELQDGQLQTALPPVWIAARRWHQPKPYIRHLQVTEPSNRQLQLSQISSPGDCLTQMADANSRLAAGVHWRTILSSSSSAHVAVLPSSTLSIDLTTLPSTPEAERCVESLVLSTLDGTKLNHDDPLRRCLQAHHNSRWKCRVELQRHRGQLQLEAHQAHVVADAFTGLRSAHVGSTVHSSSHPPFCTLCSLLVAEVVVGHQSRLLADLYLVPILRRLRQWRYMALAITFYVFCLVIMNWRTASRALAQTRKLKGYKD